LSASSAAETLHTRQRASVEILAKTSFFGPICAEDREAVAGCLRPAAFSPGQVIFLRDEEPRDLFVVRKGRVRLSILSGDGRELSFAHATEGDVFGEIAVLDGGPRTANATALTEVEALALSRSALLKLIETRPSIASAAIAFLCARLRATDIKMEAIVLHPVEVRLARFLLSAIQLQSSSANRKTCRLCLDMTQGELALLLGASRPKVNVALTALESAEAVRKDGSILICDLEMLRVCAAAD
jgi:CRP-like cAMP-binding protein